MEGGREEALQVVGTEQLINLHAQPAGRVPGSLKQGVDEATQLLGWRGRGLSGLSGPWLPLHQTEALRSLPSCVPHFPPAHRYIRPPI